MEREDTARTLVAGARLRLAGKCRGPEIMKHLKALTEVARTAVGGSSGAGSCGEDDPVDLASTRDVIAGIIEAHATATAQRRLERTRWALEQRSSKQPSRRPARSRRLRPNSGLAPATQNRLLDPVSFRAACAGGRLVPLRAYLQSGGDPNVRLDCRGGGGGVGGGPWAHTFGLHEAVAGGHLEAAAKLLASGASPAAAVESSPGTGGAVAGWTALHEAAAGWAAAASVAGPEPRMVRP